MARGDTNRAPETVILRPVDQKRQKTGDKSLKQANGWGKRISGELKCLHKISNEEKPHTARLRIQKTPEEKKRTANLRVKAISKKRRENYKIEMGKALGYTMRLEKKKGN